MRLCANDLGPPAQLGEGGTQGAGTKSQEKDLKSDPVCGGGVRGRMDSECGCGERTPGLWTKQPHSQTREGSPRLVSRGWF